MKCMKRSNPGMSREVCFSPELKRFCLIAAAPARLQPAESLFNIWNYQIGNNALIRFLPQRLNRNWVKQGILGGTTWRAERQMKSILKYPFVRNSITTVFSSFAFTDEYGSQNHHSWPLEYFLKKYFFHPLAKHSNITQYNSATQANTCKVDAY